jgi:hypothetical protein
VLTAVKLRADNVPWSEVYKTDIDGYASMSFYERIHHSRKLRRAVAALVNRRARRGG